jgi:RNA polymerase sigma-70 factor (ECF subfamily)
MAALLDADADLARALIARDANAPRLLWKRFAPMVFRILRRAMGPGHDVEDLVQDVFLCVFEKVPALREPKVLKAFVISCTVFNARSELRRLWRQRLIRVADKGDVSGDALVEVDHDGREALSRFYAVLDRINAHDRTMFVLRFIEGLEVAEVAAASGWSLATTKRRLARAWSKVTLLVDRDPLLREYLTPTEGRHARPGRALAPVHLPVTMSTAAIRSVPDVAVRVTVPGVIVD